VHCEHEHDDGAYVLGALSPAERAAYERHLATCSFCREAVADISTLPDLLSRLDAKEFAKLLDPSLTAGDHPGASLRDLAASSAPSGSRGKRRKTLGVRVLSSVAVAILVGLVGIGVLAWIRGTDTPGNQPLGPAVAMTRVQGTSPVTATLRMAGTSGGTKVELQCDYSGTQPTTLRLVAYGHDEEQEQVGSWQGVPGAEFRMDGATHFTRGELSRLELVRSDGTALLAYDVP
jgi:putative zinc finger protein